MLEVVVVNGYFIAVGSVVVIVVVIVPFGETLGGGQGGAESGDGSGFLFLRAFDFNLVDYLETIAVKFLTCETF